MCCLTSTQYDDFTSVGADFKLIQRPYWEDIHVSTLLPVVLNVPRRVCSKKNMSAAATSPFSGAIRVA